MSALSVIYNCISPSTSVRTEAHVAAHTSHILNRTSALVNFVYGVSSMYNHTDQEDGHKQELIQDEYMDKETENLNEKARAD